MEKRSCARFAAHLQARLFYGNMVYTGIITNLSDSGMFICTKMKFPVDSVLITVIQEGDHTVKLPVKIRRTFKSDHDGGYIEDSGLGVELLNPPKEYAEIVSKYRSSQG